MLKKPVNKITINDITEDCGVNRATFYYHFKDIYDLIEWSCEEDSRKAADGNTTYETWQQGLLNIFHAVEENKPFIFEYLPTCQSGTDCQIFIQSCLSTDYRCCGRVRRRNERKGKKTRNLLLTFINMLCGNNA